MHTFRVFTRDSEDCFTIRAAGTKIIGEFLELHDENGETRYMFVIRNLIGWEVAK